MSDENRRLAVLIDADNTSPKVARDMFEELAGYGTLTVKRAYGDWTSQQLGGWKGELHKHAISPMQQFANTSGKNSTDSALIIDAMDLLYAGNLDGFVIVSSDADFTRLATRLRESGMTVFGLGQRKTPKPFQDACDKFTFLEVLRDAAAEQVEPADEAGSVAADEPTGTRGEERTPARGNLQSKLTKALNRADSDDDDWVSVSALGNHLNRTDPSFDPRTYDFAKLSDLVKAQPYLETMTTRTSSGRGQLFARPKGRRSGSSEAAPKEAASDAATSTPRKRSTTKTTRTSKKTAAAKTTER